MRKTFVIPALLAMLVVGAQAYAQTATVGTQSGQRIRGHIVDMGNSGSVIVRANGRDSRIPLRDVAMIDFTGNGTHIPQYQWQRADQDGGMVVLRNGRTVAGRFQPNIPLNELARVYFGGNWSPQYGNNGQYGNNRHNPNYNPNWNPNYDPNYYPNNYPRNGNYDQYGNQRQFGQLGYPNLNRSITVLSNRQWTDTGVNVQHGQVVHFQANGNVDLSNNPADVAGPGGANSGRLAGNSPLPSVTGGTLIGRINNGPPFVVGAQSDVTMPASGRLSLGINDDYVQDNRGNFVVTMR